MQGRDIDPGMNAMLLGSILTSANTIPSPFKRLVTSVQRGNLAEVERLLPEVKEQKNGEEKIRHNILRHCGPLGHMKVLLDENCLNILKLVLHYGAKTVDGENPLFYLFNTIESLSITSLFDPICFEAAKVLIANDCRVQKDLVKKIKSVRFFDIVHSEHFYDAANALIWFIHLGITWKYDQNDIPEFNAPAEVKRKFDTEINVLVLNSLDLDPRISVNFYKIYQELLNSFVASLAKTTGNQLPNVLLGLIIDYVGYLGDKLQLSAADSPTFYQAGERLKALGMFRRRSPVANIQTEHSAAVRTPTLRLMPPSIDDVD